MIDRSIPVVLRLKHNGHDALCVARLVLEFGHLLAKPIRPPQKAQPYRPKMIRLDERNLELVRGNGLGKPIYEYHGYVLVP